jgi:hypothetical protein
VKFNVSHIVTLIFGSLIGVLIGFLLFRQNKDINHVAEQKESIKIVTEKVSDTVIVKEEVFIEVPVSDTLSDKVQVDSSFINDTLPKVQDSTSNDSDDYLTIINNDEQTEDDLEVIKDKLLDKVNATLEINELDDSLNVESALNKEVIPFSEVMNIEFWSSPLDLTGYELSTKKLKLYGFNPKEIIRLQYNKGQDYIQCTIGDLSLKLKKTERFKTLYL